MEFLSLHVLYVLCAVSPAALSTPVSIEKEKDSSFWNQKAKAELDRAVNNNEPIVGVAKNVILFLGDGMGMPTVTAARILQGQMQGKNGEEHQLSFDKFPHVALSKTYNVDHQTPDSAGTGTAYLTGVKTNMGTIGVSAQARRGNCTSSIGTHLTSILDWSHDKGKSTGVVTTTRVTHATPAASYAHTPERNWEGKVPPDDKGTCKDIAQQLVHDNNDINVVMGGGRQEFFPYGQRDPEEMSMTEGRNDTLNLVDEWLSIQTNKSRRHRYVWNLTDFDSVDPQTTDYLFGLFNPSHMQYEVDRAKDMAGEPSLAQMTEKAIKILQKNDKGFFLLVEGGRIDLAHHASQAGRALHEAVAFADAVAKAVDMLSDQDTLIVTTADHSHAFSFAGYPGRGNDILGLVKDDSGVTLALDGKPYTTMAYANGPGRNGLNNSMTGRQDLSHVNTTDPEFQQQSIVPLDYETHGGEDVAIFARGPMAHLFHGVHEQNYIAHVMAYASCVGDYSQDKDCAAVLAKKATSDSNLLKMTGWTLWVLFGSAMVLSM